MAESTESVWDRVYHFVYEFPIIPIENHAITLSHVIAALMPVVLAFVITRWVRALLARRVLRKMDLDVGLEYAILRVVHYLILAIAVYFSFSILGIPLGGLLGAFAVLGVGIGFGLQNIVSNFISGVILLGERPVKVGDRITVEDVWGDVVKINLRTTVVNTTDNVSIIIPNSKLLENNVVNWSYGDRRIRIRLPIGVAYGSDVDLVSDCLLKIAADNKHVLDDPKPKIWFTEFGDSSLNFDLVCWLADSVIKDDVINELNRALDKIFREHNIEIPFPQRDLHLRSIDGGTTFQVAQPKA